MTSSDTFDNSTVSPGHQFERLLRIVVVSHGSKLTGHLSSCGTVAHYGEAHEDNGAMERSIGIMMSHDSLISYGGDSIAGDHEKTLFGLLCNR